MRTTKAGLISLAWLLLAAGGLGLSGCGGNPNEREYQANTPPGKPPDDPNDQKVSYRRERTRNVPKQVQKIEARNQGAGTKAPTP